MQQPIPDAQLHRQSRAHGFILFAVAVIAAVLIVSSMLMDGWYSLKSNDAAPVADLREAGCVAMDKMTFMQLPQNLQMEMNVTCSHTIALQP